MQGILSAGRTRPAAPQTAARLRRPRRPHRLRGMLIAADLVALAVAVTVWRLTTAATPVAPPIPVPVSRGDIDVTVDSSGATAASRSSDLTFPAAGQVEDVLVRPGDHVTRGQPLARLDAQALQLAVTQAQAGLTSAQAALARLQAGPTAEQRAGANAALAAARANLAKVQAGASAQDLADATADRQAAEANLAKVQAGATDDQIANAEADVRSAAANLAKAQAGPTAQDLADARAEVQAAQAAVDQLTVGPSAEALAAARAGLASAQAQLTALQAGPTTAQVRAAQLQVSNADDHLAAVRSSTSLAKQQAETNLAQAANAVRDAQDGLSEAAVIMVPRKGQQNILNPDGSFNSDATQAQIDHYNAALRAEQDAEGTMHKAQLTLDDARQQESLGVADAQRALDDARQALADLQAPPAAADLAAANAAIATAQSTLAQLQAPPTDAARASAQAALTKARDTLARLQAEPLASDVAAAQATLDKARNTLNALKAGPTAADVATAQAAADKARDALARLKAEPLAADVAAAQSQVAGAQTTLAALQPTAADLAAAQAQVAAAQATLATAQRALAGATLTAPYTGTVATAPINPGDQVGVNTTAVTLVDASALHVDVDLSESDVARVATGQPVKLTFDALPQAVLTGTVTAIGTTGSSSQGVVTYLVTVSFDPGRVPVKVGMSANAGIMVEQRQGVLRVPNRALTTVGPLKSVQVLYGTQETPVTVFVQTGVTDGSWTEITGCVETGSQCLQDGDKVAVNLPAATGSSNGSPSGGTFFVGGPDGAAPPSKQIITIGNGGGK